MPQPVEWVSATTPSTFGYLAMMSGVIASAMYFAAVAEQFTLVSTPM